MLVLQSGAVLGSDQRHACGDSRALAHQPVCSIQSANGDCDRLLLRATVLGIMQRTMHCPTAFSHGTASRLQHPGCTMAPPKIAENHYAKMLRVLFPEHGSPTCPGSKKRGESGAPLRAAASALQIPSVQAAPRYIAPEEALIVPESVRVTDDSVFTAGDWNNVLKGYSSQYVEHDYWVDESMINGNFQTHRILCGISTINFVSDVTGLLSGGFGA